MRGATSVELSTSFEAQYPRNFRYCVHSHDSTWPRTDRGLVLCTSVDHPKRIHGYGHCIRCSLLPFLSRFARSGASLFSTILPRPPLLIRSYSLISSCFLRISRAFAASTPSLGFQAILQFDIVRAKLIQPLLRKDTFHLQHQHPIVLDVQSSVLGQRLIVRVLRFSGIIFAPRVACAYLRIPRANRQRQRFFPPERCATNHSNDTFFTSQNRSTAFRLPSGLCAGAKNQRKHGNQGRSASFRLAHRFKSSIVAP